MKIFSGVRRGKPSYNYTYYDGVFERRNWLPMLFYMLGLSLPMAAAVFMASLQTKTHYQPAASKQAPTVVTTRETIQQPIVQPLVAPADQDSKLQGIVTNFIATHNDHSWSVVVQGLDGDDRGASYNPNAEFNAASIYKLLMVYPLSQKAPISTWGKTTINVVGSNSTLANCMTAMLKISDNDCGDAIGDWVGWSYATGQLKTIGLNSTDLNNPTGPLTTSADTAYFLKGLYNGQWLDGATRNFVLNILSQQIYRTGIPAGCGRTCSVADKTGDLDSVRHDAGIIRYKGGAYVLSIFTSGASYADIAALASQVQAYMVAN